jgi:hypothetical protein
MLVWYVHSTWPSRTMWWMRAPTFKNKNKNKKNALHMLTHGVLQACGLTSWVVCINDKFRDIRERNVTIRSEIRPANIRSLGFGDIMGVDITEFRVYRSSNLECHTHELGSTTSPHPQAHWAPRVTGTKAPGLSRHLCISISGKNRRLVTQEPVEFEK